MATLTFIRRGNVFRTNISRILNCTRLDDRERIDFSKRNIYTHNTTQHTRQYCIGIARCYRTCHAQLIPNLVYLFASYHITPSQFLRYSCPLAILRTIHNSCVYLFVVMCTIFFDYRWGIYSMLLNSAKLQYYIVSLTF